MGLFFYLAYTIFKHYENTYLLFHLNAFVLYTAKGAILR